MNKRNGWMVCVVILLAWVGLAGCWDRPGRGGPATAEPSAEAETGQGRDSRSPVVISTARVLNDGDYDKLKAPDTIDDNPITRWARDRLGVIQTNKWIVADEAALQSKVKLALSGEEELPDILYLNDQILPVLLNDLAASGRFMDIGEAFERYASPRMKRAYALNPDVWKTVRADGKLWGLPQISDGKVGDPILWIRQDWLDRLGLSAPATLEQLAAVLDAFTNRDPDGNGVKDTIGLALAGKNSLNAWMGDASFLFGAYGDQPYQWNRMPDGSLAYGSVQPEIERGLTTLREWYAKGYIHPNFGTHDELTAASLFMSGEAGVISGPGWMGGWPLGELAKNPGEDKPVFKPIPFPSGPDGKVGRRGSELSYGSYVFRRDFQHLEQAFRYWDAVYGALIEDPDSDFVHGFGENYDYKIVDGVVLYDFPGMTTTIAQQVLIAPGSVPPGVMSESLEQRVYRGKTDTPYEKKMAATNSRLFLEGIIVGDRQLAYAQRDQFVGARGPVMQMKWPALQKLEKEAFLRIVYGKDAPESFAAFVQSWKTYGGEEITREINDWDKSNK